MQQRVPTVAIVGAGASGVLLAAHLLRCASSQSKALHIVLIDRHELGGAAYSTTEPAHRLNVPASQLSAFPDAAGDFIDWCVKYAGACDPTSYMPRLDFGRYLARTLAEAEQHTSAGVTLDRRLKEVSSVDPHKNGVTMQLSDGSSVIADVAVLALGNLPSVPPPGCEATLHHAAYMNDPWQRGALDKLAPTGNGIAILIGTGLTMIDVAIVLANRFPHLAIVAVSRNGHLPHAHLPPSAVMPPVETLDLHTSAPLLHYLSTVFAESAAGHPWQHLIDRLRPYNADLWQRLSLEQRANFMATRYRMWSLHRHRMAPEVAKVIEDLISTGKLRLKQGSVQLKADATGALDATFSNGERLSPVLVVNCTGPCLDPRQSKQELVRQLLEKHITTHPLGMGFATANDGALLNHDGVPHKRLFTLGPTRVGDLLESIAIREIRNQAHHLAAHIVASLTGQ